MKKTVIAILTLAICLTAAPLSLMTASAANVTYQAVVYDTDGEGLSLKANPEVDSERYAVIPEDTVIMIDQTSNGWGHTYYNGQSGWVYLTYTKVRDRYISQYPTNGFTDTVRYYTIQNTDGEGLELRTAPTNESSTFGAIREGAVVTVQAIQGSWAYTYYSGNFGWTYLEYMIPFKGKVSYRVTVYDTDGEGLALKSDPDVDSVRYELIPEKTQLSIDKVTDTGWGHTTYNNSSGWVSLRYTRIVGDYCSKIPTTGYTNAAYYTIYDTEGEGLEFRCAPTVESSTYGPIFDGTSVLVEAIEDDWAFFSFNGHYGWSNLMYLRK